MQARVGAGGIGSLPFGSGALDVPPDGKSHTMNSAQFPRGYVWTRIYIGAVDSLGSLGISNSRPYGAFDGLHSPNQGDARHRGSSAAPQTELLARGALAGGQVLAQTRASTRCWGIFLAKKEPWTASKWWSASLRSPRVWYGLSTGCFAQQKRALSIFGWRGPDQIYRS